jgi:prolyl-tRNA synthetase
MRLSRYFLPILKDNPKDAEIISHRLMLRAGMIRQLGAGLYEWLPLGLKVLNKVENLVRKGLDDAGCLELKMPIVQPTSLWAESGRSSYGDETLKIVDRHENNFVFSPTCEEVICDIFRKNTQSYKDLPRNLYQINYKFRDEIRPRFGVMRGREFLMKDGYSFHENYDDAKREYELMYDTYFKIFKSLGVVAVPFLADSGQIGGNLSHEFQVIAATGESEIYYDEGYENPELTTAELRNLYAATDEKYDGRAGVKKARGIEVGHIFYLGKKYSDAMNVSVQGRDGKPFVVEMCTFGIGVSRMVGAIIEAHHDDRGIVFPSQVAPFDVVLLNLKPKDADTTAKADELYNKLKSQGLDVLYDDTDAGIGSKFAAAELIGVPQIISVGNQIETLDRKTGIKTPYGA